MRTSPRPVNQAELLRNIGVIRVALIGGVLAFGVVIWFLHRSNQFPARPQDPVLAYAPIVLAIGAVLFAFVQRGPLARESDDTLRASKLLICWAVGEGAALFGGVVFLLGGEVQPYLIGLVAVFIVHALTPNRRSLPIR